MKTHDLPSYVVKPGSTPDLEEWPTNKKEPFDDEEEAQPEFEHHRLRIQELQERLWAEKQQSLLVVLQATDTGGKDGTIRGVFSGVNPQGCRVVAFKQPSVDELDHDFLWRIHHQTPAKGEIAIFNRSHYEDVLVARVRKLVPEEIWKARYEQINRFEQLLAENGTTILKFFLHISKEEQRERLQARLDDPLKRWKFLASDLDDRALWDDYQAAYTDAIVRCSTSWAPWHVIPADRKWYRNVVIAKLVADTLEGMDPQVPEPVPGIESTTIPK